MLMDKCSRLTAAALAGLCVVSTAGRGAVVEEQLVNRNGTWRRRLACRLLAVSAWLLPSPRSSWAAVMLHRGG
jgi:hypothetical protein